MATLKLVILPHKVLKDGTHKIRVAVSHRQQTSYILQSITIDMKRNLEMGQVVGRSDAGLLNRKLACQVNEYQDALDRIDPDAYTCAQLKSYIEKNTKAKALTISQAANEHIDKKEKESTKTGYRITLRHFVDCFGDVPLEMISPKMIADFDLYLKNERNMSSTSRAINLRQLKAFINPQIKIW